ncbi:hypothetical protein R1sor_016881 [Riccia sorocarpa]|uniref:Uncharacterized protein n=1 Tax=Riccia sorocarpa TaxID=122646 RepID=A0ABD3HGC2_9MARC
MGREDVAYVDPGGPAFSLTCSVSPASSCSSSSSNSEMKPRAMARSVGAQKNAARHRMTKRDYEMIVTYLENPGNFAAINGCGRKTKITGKTLTNVTAFGHRAVTLCAQGFVKCSGVIMGKKVAHYVCTYKNARTFYLSTGSGLTEAEIDAGLTLEQKMNAKCHYFFRMHTLFDARANVEPPAVGDAGLPAELVFDVLGLCKDSQAAVSETRSWRIGDRPENRERGPEFRKESKLCTGLEQTALSSPTTLRIWDLIAANLQYSGVQCTPLEAKVQWDSLAWGYLLIAYHSDDCGGTVHFDMTAEERIWSGLPPNFPKSWYDDIKAFYPHPL